MDKTLADIFNIPQIDVPSADKQRQEDEYLPMVHHKATDSIASMVGAKEERNLLGAATLTSGEVKLVIDGLERLGGLLGVSTHKLLSVSMALFTDQNHLGAGHQSALRTAEVAFPLKEYATLCGYEVTPRQKTGDPELDKKETARAKSQLDKVRRKVKKDLQLLLASSLSMHNVNDWAGINVLGSESLTRGLITVEFSSKIAKALIKCPITQYPTALLRLDERNANAYAIGLAMAEHFNMDNNQLRGTAQILKVKTLLEKTTLPSIEEIRKQRTSWEDRIKEPIEVALDALHANGVLEDWRYSKSKGAELTDEEATNFSSFEDWAETRLFYILKNAPNHAPRLEARQEEKRQALKKQGSRKAKKAASATKTTATAKRPRATN